VQCHIIKHFFNYTKQTHNIYYLHTFTVLLLHASVVQICKAVPFYEVINGSNHR